MIVASGDPTLHRTVPGSLVPLNYPYRPNELLNALGRLLP